MPLPYRWLTSLLMRYNGSCIMIDCGEGTQIALKEAGFSPNPIDVICFTHFHADHISGLPGFLLSMGNADRTDPVTMIGPKGLEKVVNSLRVIVPELPFEIKFLEISEREQVFDFGDYAITAFKVNHGMPCYGYSLSIKRAGRFDADRAKAQNIPLNLWSRLQKGETIEDDGVVYTPDMVLGDERRGLKVTYVTDTRPVPVISTMASGADLFICEGMYGEEGMEEKAKEHKHMTFYEAAQLAKNAEVPPKEMWLTHYSPSLSYPKDYEKAVRAIFKNTKVSKDGRRVDLQFDEE